MTFNKEQSTKTICFVLTSLKSGGLERNASLLANHFASCGHKVYICCLYSTRCFFDLSKDVEIIDCHSEKNKFASVRFWINTLKEVFKNKNIETVVSFGDRCGIVSAKAVKGLNINHICRGVNTKKNVLNKTLLDVNHKNIRTFVFQTNAQKQLYSKKIQKIGVVFPNPFHLESTNLNTDGLKSKKFVTVASFKLKQKRQDLMIKAFALFSKNHPDYIFEFYGECLPKEKEIINNLIIENKLENKVFLMGETKDVKQSITPSRAFICASTFEGMPNALIEALSYGIPVITTRWNGYSEIITDEVNGLTLPIDDIQELTRKMEEIADDDVFTKLNNNAPKHIIGDFTEEKVFSKWDEII